MPCATEKKLKIIKAGKYLHYIKFGYENSLTKENIEPEFLQQEHCYSTLRFECNGLSAVFH